MCKKCGGKCFIDSDSKTPRLIDLVCIICGYRKIYDIYRDEFGKKLYDREKMHRIMGANDI